MTGAQWDYLAQYRGTGYVRSVTMVGMDMILVTEQKLLMDGTPIIYVDRIASDGRLVETNHG